jgi:phytoene dehydrogenase-like protein
MFLTVTTLKDPSKMHSGHHTCESFAFVGYEAFEQWAHSKYGARPTDYDAMKEDLAWRMVRGLEKRIPGLSRHIMYYSLGTPLTNEHYLNATCSAIFAGRGYQRVARVLEAEDRTWDSAEGRGGNGGMNMSECYN